MGSAVVVSLEQLDSERKPFVPARIKKYLLTCAHVVRAAHDGAVFEEILCWKAGGGYSRIDNRSRGDGALVGASHARIDPVSPCAAKQWWKSTAGADDWVLLDVDGDAFQAQPAVRHWVDGVGVPPLTLVGYPGGAGWTGTPLWQNGDIVAPRDSPGFTISRSVSHPGIYNYSGNGTARVGMSGGGVFDSLHRLVAIHRSATDEAMELGAVSATHICEWLASRGYQAALAPSVEPKSEPTPPPKPPPPDVNRWWIWILVALAIAIPSARAAYVSYRSCTGFFVGEATRLENNVHTSMRFYPADARASARTLTERCPLQASAWNLLGNVLYQMAANGNESYEEALGAYSKGLALESSEDLVKRLKFNAAAVLITLGRYSDAKSLLTDLQAASPGDGLVTTSLQLIEVNSGHYDEAEQWFAQRRERGDTSVEKAFASVAGAIIHLKRGEGEKGTSLLKKSVCIRSELHQFLRSSVQSAGPANLFIEGWNFEVFVLPLRSLPSPAQSLSDFLGQQKGDIQC